MAIKKYREIIIFLEKGGEKLKEQKEKAIWILWKFMKKKDGKMTKVPISYLGKQ